MVEASVPTFKALCLYQGSATLAADRNYIELYFEVLQLFAAFASKDVNFRMKSTMSVPVAFRFRKVVLEAFYGVASSESLGSETSRQLSIIIPIILENLYSNNSNNLALLERIDMEGELENDEANQRRQSCASHVSESNDTNPIEASGTTEDIDKLAERHVGIVALQALRKIFTAVNRAQLRLATSVVVKFVTCQAIPQKQLSNHSHSVQNDCSWPTSLFGVLCGWVPVQDRFAIIATIVEALVRTSLAKEEIQKHFVLTNVISWLFGSNISFIGLSVMDILISLMQHMHLVLQQGDSKNILESHSLSQLGEENPLTEDHQSYDLHRQTSMPFSDMIFKLLKQLQQCLGNLASHVYYTDQISDMLSAIMRRLPPSQYSNTSVPLPVINNSDTIPEKSSANSYFSSDAAKLVALSTAKRVLIVSNSGNSDGGSGHVNRGRVGISAWEGTQWLLRDPNGGVRKSYVDVLLTWLSKELCKGDRLLDDSQLYDTTERGRRRKNGERSGSFARRAISNHRERPPRTSKPAFLQLLHLVVYENMHQFQTHEPDIQLLHLLLTGLVQHLGVNSVRHGLPMIMRLQEDANVIDDPEIKIRFGSVVHGYFWALSIYFDFETSSVGREIHCEIASRNHDDMWMSTIRVPPIPLKEINLSAPPLSEKKTSCKTGCKKIIKSLDDRQALVDQIARGYSSFSSMQTSLHKHPGHSVLTPFVHHPQQQDIKLSQASQLPSIIMTQLMSDWTKDICGATAANENSFSDSLSGSRSTPQSTSRNDVPIVGHNGNSGLTPTCPTSVHSFQHLNRPTCIGASTSNMANSRTVLHVSDLKRILSGSSSRPGTALSTTAALCATPSSFSDVSRSSKDVGDCSGTESLVSVNSSISEISFSSVSTERVMVLTEGKDSVPPVPPFPETLRSKLPHEMGNSHADLKSIAKVRNVATGGITEDIEMVQKSCSVKSEGNRAAIDSQSRDRDGQVGDVVGSERNRGRVHHLAGLLNAIDGDEEDGESQNRVGGHGLVPSPPY